MSILDEAAQQTHYSDEQRRVRAEVRKMYTSAQNAIAGYARIEKRVGDGGDLPLMTNQHQQMAALLQGSDVALIQAMQAAMNIAEAMEAAVQEQGHVLFGIPVTPVAPEPEPYVLPEEPEENDV